MTDIVKDMATLTTIPEKSLNKFYRKMIFCICEGVAEDLLNEDIEISEMNIGIGTLYIKHSGGDIKYHFIPNNCISFFLNEM